MISTIPFFHTRSFLQINNTRYYFILFGMAMAAVPVFSVSSITNCNISRGADIDITKQIPHAPIRGKDNILSGTFDTLDNNHLPEGWKITISGEHSHPAKVTALRSDTPGCNIIKIDIPEEESVHVDTIQPERVDPKKEYLLIVQFKVDHMHYIGHWYHRPAGIRLEICGTNNKKRWLAVCGEGSTDGWVTAILPFPDRKNRRDARNFAQARVFLRCYNMAGVVYFRSPILLRKPAGVDGTSFFEFENGKQVFGNVMTLTNCKG